MMHEHFCINHTPPLQWKHDPQDGAQCLEPEEALCDPCYDEQSRLNLAQKIYQAGMSYASGQFD